MKKQSLTSEKYKGKTIQFVKVAPDAVFARVPSISTQFFGSGKNKRSAVKNTKRAIDFVENSKKRKEILKKKGK